MKGPFIRSPYNYDRKAASDEATIVTDPVSLTVQSQKDDADINVLMRRFGVTGHIPESLQVPMYGDFSEIGDFRSAWEAVRAAEDNFMKVPAEVRARFSNDPQLYLDFCSDPRNLDELRNLGLAKSLPLSNNAPAVDVPPQESKK